MTPKRKRVKELPRTIELPYEGAKQIAFQRFLERFGHEYTDVATTKVLVTGTMMNFVRFKLTDFMREDK